MENALFISKIENLKFLKKKYSRLYFGNEFCERLIPNKEDISFVLEFIKRKKIELTLITPYVTDNGLNNLKNLFKLVIKENLSNEIVINDWGVMRLLLNDYKEKFKLVLGRLLTKQKRGPRILHFINNLPKEALNHFKSSNIIDPTMIHFLSKRNIGRVELDNPLQSIGMDFSKTKIKASMYYPYSYVTTTRMCLTNSCDKVTERGRIGIFPCGRECQNYYFILKQKEMPKKLILKGNTQFYKNSTLPKKLEKTGIDRIVYQPEIPI